LNANGGPQKIREAFEYIHANHMNDFDWIIKVEKNAFVVLENLRHLLYQYDTQWPVAIGQRFLLVCEIFLSCFNLHNFSFCCFKDGKDVFRDEYVLSKKTFNLLVEEAFKDETNCNTKSGNPDAEISKCMESVKVVKVEGVDDKGELQIYMT
jgi:hypothetical protein